MQITAGAYFFIRYKRSFFTKILQTSAKDKRLPKVGGLSKINCFYFYYTN
ncbi:hypothetical protein HMPREF0027_2447 [Actinobacillus ureae ATCC 25976]|uniref:Uncharacterized protein n=1 Tax=Actinobacillus ureae ATCC 25976 TaxID=887324 RepID=E8KKT0_9PAST|nr:hypothetical protein HMPREF0027_2447 [Actinobacillus ureae ATCC 25976]